MKQIIKKNATALGMERFFDTDNVLEYNRYMSLGDIELYELNKQEREIDFVKPHPAWDW